MGLIIGLSIISAWAVHLLWALFFVEAAWNSIGTYLHILLQAYLYTGLFITAHDSMHGAVAKNRKVNNAAGQLALWLFAAFSYRKMFKKHMAHHRAPGTADDPDFSEGSQNFFIWFFAFFFRYISFLQILTMAILFNIGLYLLDIPLRNLLLFWVLPAFLGTFQLFFFGTFLPHRKPHTEDMLPYNSRTQKKNHAWAMLSCYFFGYHYEHHAYPRTPWWQLYKRKKEA